MSTEDFDQCPLCNNLFALSKLPQHASTCNGEVDISSVLCPLCNLPFPADQILEHSSNCGEIEEILVKLSSSKRSNPVTYSTKPNKQTKIDKGDSTPVSTLPTEPIVIASSDFVSVVSCPLCAKEFPQNEIQQHAWQCGQDLQMAHNETSNSSQSKTNETDMILCMSCEQLAPSYEVILLDHCGHRFHFECIKQEARNAVETAAAAIRRGKGNKPPPTRCTVCQEELSLRDLKALLSLEEYKSLAEASLNGMRLVYLRSVNNRDLPVDYDAELVASIESCLMDYLGKIEGNASAIAVADTASRRRAAASDSSRVWSKGVGYGGARENTRELAQIQQQIEKALAKQSEQDALMQHFMHELAGLLSRVPLPDVTVAAPAAVSTSEDQISNDVRVPLGIQAALFMVAPQIDLILHKLLRNDSLPDIVERLPLYQSLFTLLRVFLDVPFLFHFLDASDPVRSIFHPSHNNGNQSDDPSPPYLTLLRALNRQAEVFIKMMKKDANSADDDRSVAVAALAFHMSDTYDIMERVFRARAEAAVRDKQRENGYKEQPSEGNNIAESSSSSSSSSAKAAESKEQVYLKALRPMQFEFCDIDVKNHTYEAEINASSKHSPSRERARRLQNDITALSTSLPLSYDDGIFVRIDNNRSDVMRFLIFGNAGTPYHNGCFCFDMFIPLDYPQSPPKVTLRTTDHGRVRFNPNLYANGKVCLSLLGTWNGPGWDPKISTILQVLLSIQSLILVAEPFFNEPGHEMVENRVASSNYNRCIYYETFRVAIANSILEPVMPEFVNVINTHCRLKSDDLREQFKTWHDEILSISGGVLTPAMLVNEGREDKKGDLHDKWAKLKLRVEKALTSLETGAEK